MKKLFRAVGVFGFLLCFSGQLQAQAFDSCDQWATFSDGEFNVYNNIWGSGAGSQCLWANAYNDWGVWAEHSGSGIKSYPNVSHELSINVDSLGACTSSFNVSAPASGAYSSTYDIWFDNHAYELMIWMNQNGSIAPISYNWSSAGQPVPESSNTSVGGHTWNIYRGSNGGNEVFSFVRTSDTNSGTVDLQAIAQWIRNNGWFGNANLHKIEFGFEITTASNLNLSVNDYSLSCSEGSGGDNGGGSGGAITNGRYAIISTYSGRAIDVEASSTENGANILLWSYGGGTNQQWDIQDLGNGYYSIRAAHSGKALDVYNFCSDPGCEIRQWDYWGSDNQQWQIIDSGNGNYKIVSRYNGMPLDVWEWNAENGADVRQWTDGGDVNQQWQFQGVN